jgi:hypothetical protein
MDVRGQALPARIFSACQNSSACGNCEHPLTTAPVSWSAQHGRLAARSVRDRPADGRAKNEHCHIAPPGVTDAIVFRLLHSAE